MSDPAPTFDIPEHRNSKPREIDRAQTETRMHQVATEDAIKAGALDIASEENKLVVETAPADVIAVAQKLQNKLGIQLEEAQVVCMPNKDSMITLSAEQEPENKSTYDANFEQNTIDSGNYPAGYQYEDTQEQREPENIDEIQAVKRRSLGPSLEAPSFEMNPFATPKANVASPGSPYYQPNIISTS
ncbi:hypothetical protein AYL99_11597 [Fonsecaea erecta]|uniref:TACO1/YebC-like second and third domain-containing protein n=1 Tax=Fonsecaea erecta TaxID=1367422 RepID=A0A178Z4E1_9EURO|nr:hypothetical protein AYL99_11597 [Fonsecaea erecta]OAP54063.1 hypothetical protein AYL99_11597 [Fonsecaea erecta]